MNKISHIVELVKKRKVEDDEGFSLIELVVAVGILSILSVTGVVAYSQIIEGTRKTATDAAAAQVYTAVIAAEHDGNSETTPAKVVEAYNKTKSDSNITVVIVPATSTKQIGVTAINTDVDPTYTASRGSQSK